MIPYDGVEVGENAVLPNSPVLEDRLVPTKAAMASRLKIRGLEMISITNGFLAVH